VVISSRQSRICFVTVDKANGMAASGSYGTHIYAYAREASTRNTTYTWGSCDVYGGQWLFHAPLGG
jgi:hypothetical protein